MHDDDWIFKYISWLPYTTVTNVALQKNKQEEDKKGIFKPKSEILRAIFLPRALFFSVLDGKGSIYFITLWYRFFFFSWNLLNCNSRSPDSVNDSKFFRLFQILFYFLQASSRWKIFLRVTMVVVLKINSGTTWLTQFIYGELSKIDRWVGTSNNQCKLLSQCVCDKPLYESFFFFFKVWIDMHSCCIFVATLTIRYTWRKLEKTREVFGNPISPRLVLDNLIAHCLVLVIGSRC